MSTNEIVHFNPAEIQASGLFETSNPGVVVRKAAEAASELAAVIDDKKLYTSIGGKEAHPYRGVDAARVDARRVPVRGVVEGDRRGRGRLGSPRRSTHPRGPGDRCRRSRMHARREALVHG